MPCQTGKLCSDFNKFELGNPAQVNYFLRMNVSVEVRDKIILCFFQGEVRLEDIIESWNKLFEENENLQNFKGVVYGFLEAEILHEDKNLNLLVEYLSKFLDQLKDLRIAVVMDTPMVTSTIIVGQRMKHLQIKPFATEQAALKWVGV